MLRPILSLILLLTAPLCCRGESVTAKIIPFDFKDGLIWVDVSVSESPKPLHFLLDSGASVSVVDLDIARRLGLRLGRPVSVSGVGSTGRGYWPQRLEAQAGEVDLPGKYLALDLAGLSNACAARVDGLIGADFFRNEAVQIDFNAQLIRLLPARAKMPHGTALDLKRVRGTYLTPAIINDGSPQWLRVDTGCNSALQWVHGTRVARPASSSISIALSELSIPEATTRVRLGDRVLESVPTGLHEQAIFRGEDGLLGNGLLSRFSRITLNARTGKIIFEGARPRL